MDKKDPGLVRKEIRHKIAHSKNVQGTVIPHLYSHSIHIFFVCCCLLHAQIFPTTFNFVTFQMPWTLDTNVRLNISRSYDWRVLLSYFNRSALQNALCIWILGLWDTDLVPNFHSLTPTPTLDFWQVPSLRGEMVLEISLLLSF